jgi:hypothetical protein
MNTQFTSSPTPNSGDNQTQMIVMMAKSFSKLSTALADKNTDMKSNWPKFAGDAKKFCSWYQAIIEQLPLSLWKEFYNSTVQDVVSTASNSTLNGKLYSKLLLSLEGVALQHIVSRKHLRENGLLLL